MIYDMVRDDIIKYCMCVCLVEFCMIINYMFFKINILMSYNIIYLLSSYL